MAPRPRLLLAALLVAAAACGAVVTAAAQPVPVLRIGAVFPLSGPQASLAGQEELGVRIAVDIANSRGGVDGRRIELDERDIASGADVTAQVDSLRDDGVPAIIGAYSSALSIPVSAAASADHLLYWEAGATADRVTGRGLPLVYRVGATGGQLGGNSANFTATVLAPRLHIAPASLRTVVVHAADDYGDSVEQGALRAAKERGLGVVADIGYDPYAPHFDALMPRLAALHPDVLILASYVLDGVAFRRAMLAAHLHTGALIGSTMAECGPEFGALLGADATGVFASDRPAGGFDPGALTPQGRTDYALLAAAWRDAGGGVPTEEGLAGFSAAWALLHDVMPRASSLTPAALAAAADATELPPGTLPNGAGIRFSQDAATRGQNLDAAAVIWQWQAVDHSVVVWPPVYANGSPAMVPLPR